MHTTDTALIRRTALAIVARQDSVKAAKSSRLAIHAHEGKPIANGEFSQWTDISTPRGWSLIENILGEPIQLHNDHLLEDVLRNRPVIVHYRFAFNYIVEALIFLLFLSRCVGRPPQPLSLARPLVSWLRPAHPRGAGLRPQRGLHHERALAHRRTRRRGVPVPTYRPEVSALAAHPRCATDVLSAYIQWNVVRWLLNELIDSYFHSTGTNFLKAKLRKNNLKQVSLRPDACRCQIFVLSLP